MSVFEFKKFTVRQQLSAAKITSDATVFASAIQLSTKVKRVLEVGAGTGVLSSIIAQKSPLVNIEAIEIDANAFEECKVNFESSPWSDRMRIFNADFKNFDSAQDYDLIFSNPPFFQDNLQSTINQAKNVAYHTDFLPFEDLAKGIELNLKPEGEAHIMLPKYEMSLFAAHMKEIGFYCLKQTELKHRPGSKTIRIFATFERTSNSYNIETRELYMRDEKGDYHPSYVKLMKDLLTIF